MADEDDTAAAEAAAAPATAAAPKGARTMVIWTRPGHEIAMHSAVMVPSARVEDLRAAGFARKASKEEAAHHGKSARPLDL